MKALEFAQKSEAHWEMMMDLQKDLLMVILKALLSEQLMEMYLESNLKEWLELILIWQWVMM